MRDKTTVLATLLVVLLVSCVSGAGRHEDAALPPSGEPITQREMSSQPTLDDPAYASYVGMYRESVVIPGLFEQAVPQGMAYLPAKDWLLISNYMNDGRQSCVVAVSMDDGVLQRVYWLEEPDGTPHMGHVGGLAVSDRTLWVASGQGVFHVGIGALDGGETLTMDGFVLVATKGSFATFANGMLWVGEFTRSDGSYPVPRSHNVRAPSGVLNLGWMAAYALGPGTDLIGPGSTHDGVAYPQRIISIPHEVQGAAFLGDTIVLSHSYGRQNRSRITVWQNPMAGDSWAEFEPPEGPPVPVWVLDDSVLLSRIIAPPMSEGIVMLEDEVLVLYESGSDKYRETARDPMDRVHILDLNPR